MEFSVYLPNTASFVATDRIMIQVVGYNANTSGSKPQTFNVYFEGSDNYSYGMTSIP